MTKEKINIRTGRQVDMMRSAGETACEILQLAAASIKPGVTTKEVDLYAAELIAERGCKSAFLGYRNFPGNICISVNEEVVHGIGGPRKVKYGDIVKIDVGIVKEGWVGDNALTVPVGTVSPEIQRLLMATEESLHVAIEHAVHGEMLGTMCAAIEEHVITSGFSVVREFVGHGVGRKLHEAPQVPNYGRKGEKPRLREGMILAIEPMVNEGTARVKVLSDKWTVVTMDRKPSAHFEHTVLVGKGKAEILTPRPRLTF